MAMPLPTDADLTRIIERAQKLKNLADRAGTVDEAAVAAQKLQELLFKYNLDMAVLETGDEQDARSATVTRQDYNLGNEGGQVTWKRQLLGIIADFNFCRVVIWTGSDRAAIVGEPHNITVVTSLYEYLKVALIRMADEAYDRDKADGVTAASRTKYRYWFYRGALVAIHDRLAAQRAQDEAQADEKALVLVDERVSQAFAEMFPNLRSERVSAQGYADQAALRSGHRAGHSVALDPQVGSGGVAGRLGA